MEQNQNPSGDDTSPPAPRQPLDPYAPELWSAGDHLPAKIDPLEPLHPDTVFTETKRLRHDGWTPAKKKLFLERFAECGVIVEACHAAGMSARAAYNLRDRDPLFAAGWEAACVMAQRPLADEVFSRARNGVVERIYKDGMIVAERHRHDNRLTMAVLARLDARIDRAAERGSAHLRLVAKWDEYLAALGDGRTEDGEALLSARGRVPAQPGSLAGAGRGENAENREHRELHPAGSSGSDVDRHELWETETGWWTNYPPPADFDGEEQGIYGDDGYRRTLSRAEQAVLDEDDEQDLAASRAVAEAQRDAFFGLGVYASAHDAPLEGTGDIQDADAAVEGDAECPDAPARSEEDHQPRPTEVETPRTDATP